MPPIDPIINAEALECYSRVALSLTARMNAADREAFIKMAKGILSDAKFGSEEGRTKLKSTISQLEALPTMTVARKENYTQAIRVEWSKLLHTEPKSTSVPQTIKPATLASYASKNSTVASDPLAVNKNVTEYLQRPTVGNQFDFPTALGKAADFESVAQALPEDVRKVTSEIVLQAILARQSLFDGDCFPGADEAVRMAARNADIQIADVLRRLLSKDTNLMAYLRGQTDERERFLTFSFNGADSLALRLLKDPDLNLNEREMIDFLKYPTWAGKLRAEILAKLAIHLGSKSTYTSIWSMLRDFETKHPALYEFAKLVPVRPPHDAWNTTESPWKFEFVVLFDTS